MESMGERFMVQAAGFRTTDCVEFCNDGIRTVELDTSSANMATDYFICGAWCQVCLCRSTSNLPHQGPHTSATSTCAHGFVCTHTPFGMRMRVQSFVRAARFH